MKLWLFGAEGAPRLLESVKDSRSKLATISLTHNIHEQPEYWLDIDNRLLDGLSDEEVISSAKGFLQVVNGYAKLSVGITYSTESLGKIRYDDAFEFEADQLPLHGIDAYSYERSGATSLSINYKPYKEIEGFTLEDAITLIDKAYFEDDILNLLVLLGEDLNWVFLYSIYDTVKHYSDEKGIRDEVFSVFSGREINHFTGTANDFKTLGPMARHGMWSRETPRKIISFDEAILIIEKLVYSYFEIAHGVSFSPAAPMCFDESDTFTGIEF